MTEETAQTTVQTLFDAYKRLPEDAHQSFKKLLDKDTKAGYKNADWLSYSTETLKDLRDDPEEDYWDELYAKQHPAN